MNYVPVIGLEIHAELKTKSKMFCSSANDPNERHPNVNVCPICMGHPGTLPSINGDAVRRVIKTGLALNCQIRENAKFDRKNYFYPDLPKGYQISQYDMPLCGEGFLEIDGKKIRITRVHLEEDTGRLIHPKGTDYTLVDFNRAGVPLMELVTEPDISSGEEAWKFASELQLILRYLGVSDADMEKGQMRVEANISMSKNSKLGTKVEIKNLNSFRAVEKGIAYEIDRQEKILKAGKRVMQETRGWNEAREETFSQRAKEEVHDYRYFPEPDLPPLHLDNEGIREILSEIPEIPSARRNRFRSEYQIGNQEIEIFIFNQDLGEYFEKVMSELKEWEKVSQREFFELAKICANYLITDLQGLLKGLPFSEEDLQITPENFAELMTMIHRGQVSSKMAKQVLTEMFASGGDPSQIIEERGLVQITDEAVIEKIVKEVIAQNPNPVADYKKGKENALQFLVGQVMQRTKGRANPEKVRQSLMTNLR